MDLAAFAGTPKLGTLPEILFPQKEFILVILPRTFHFAISTLNIYSLSFSYQLPAASCPAIIF